MRKSKFSKQYLKILYPFSQKNIISTRDFDHLNFCLDIPRLKSFHIKNYHIGTLVTLKSMIFMKCSHRSHFLWTRIIFGAKFLIPRFDLILTHKINTNEVVRTFIYQKIIFIRLEFGFYKKKVEKKSEINHIQDNKRDWLVKIYRVIWTKRDEN